jgi:hypothetical protein
VGGFASVSVEPPHSAACLALQFYATVRDIDPPPSGAGAADSRRRFGSVADLMGWGASVPCVPRPKGSSVGRKVRPERADGESPMLGTAGGPCGYHSHHEIGLQ